MSWALLLIAVMTMPMSDFWNLAQQVKCRGGDFKRVMLTTPYLLVAVCDEKTVKGESCARIVGVAADETGCLFRLTACLQKVKCK